MEDVNNKKVELLKLLKQRGEKLEGLVNTGAEGARLTEMIKKNVDKIDLLIKEFEQFETEAILDKTKKYASESVFILSALRTAFKNYLDHCMDFEISIN